MMGADEGDVISLHWIGTYYHIAYGVTQNMEKAIEYLQKACDAGNGQSAYQLFMIYAGIRPEDAKFKDIQWPFSLSVTYLEMNVRPVRMTRST